VTKKKIAIIGGGLAGVYAAYRLYGRGIEFDLFESRARLGGRILSTEPGGFDLGPSWFWPDFQIRMQNLVAELGLPTFQQYEDGDALVESPATGILRRQGYRSGNISMRIEGGTCRLVQALASSLPQAAVHLDAALISVHMEDQDLRLVFSDHHIQSSLYSQLWLAIPPRLAGRVHFTPSLSPIALQQMANVPTWMAAHAKYVARYARPFWREQGLSGDAFSHVGPLAEIHDACNESGSALFGFVGIDAAGRQDMAASDLKALCREQLKRLFGDAAANPIDDYIYDWATDPFTATEEDQIAQWQHGRHELSRAHLSAWGETLHLIGSEAGGEQGGYMEGALEAVDKALSELSKSVPGAVLPQGD
jgi:monoamine oxidase